MTRLLARLPVGFTATERDRIQRAYEFAAHRHTGQLRESGDPYITHPVAVAEIAVDAADDRVLALKVLDRLHDMRTLRALDQARRQLKSQQTLDVIAPLAERLACGSSRTNANRSPAITCPGTPVWCTECSPLDR
jgi:(p)ppGpp synthase/HD superfamily hydrolase